MISYQRRGAPARVWSVRGCDPRHLCAFTLLEILVVLAILGLLTVLAINNIGKAQQNAERMVAQVFVQQTMSSALLQYRIAMREFPSTAEGLQALVSAPSGKSGQWSGPYIQGKLPPDPWNESYQYAFPGRQNKDGYDIWSKGPDRQSGTEDDIGNWDAKPPGG